VKLRSSRFGTIGIVATIGRAHSAADRRPCLNISRSTRLRHAAALSL
jgi:hypothetical protein